jgi:hypothetical protein
MQHFLSRGIKKNYIVIWSCMLLEDVIHVFYLLALQAFFGQFVITFGHEQYMRTLGELTIRTYYYPKDLNHVYFACQGLPN